MSDLPDDTDLTAAEYVLGTLDGAERAGFAALVEGDARVRAAVVAWEARLAPLVAMVPDRVPPETLWPRIERAVNALASGADIIPLAAHRPRSVPGVRFWQATTALAGAIAAVLLLYIATEPRQPAVYTAAIVSNQAGTAVWIASTKPDGSIVVTAQGPIDHPSDRDLELWALAADATKPVPLGVLPASGSLTVAARNLPREHLKLLVSLEPKGGSPTGLPTGPVLYGGALVVLR